MTEVGGWDWVRFDLPSGARSYTTWYRDWDGLFMATCSCGKYVPWNAFRIEPICSCTMRTEDDPWPPNN